MYLYLSDNGRRHPEIIFQRHPRPIHDRLFFDLKKAIERERAEKRLEEDE
jgi:hypothetical protein